MCASSTTTATADRARQSESTLASRLLANPTPALKWAAVFAALLAVEFGAFLAGSAVVLNSINMGITALLDMLLSTVDPGFAGPVLDLQGFVAGNLEGLRQFGESLPTLLSRDVIPNQGWQTGPTGPWEGTFLGLQPAYAWAVRTLMIVAYTIVMAYWLFRAWLVFRKHYRAADWTPRDDIVDRLRGHRWAEFGIVVLLLFLTMALFAPALGTASVDQNVMNSYSYDIKYFDQEAGEVATINAGKANFNSKSKGAGEENVAPMTYDDFGRFHPFGTNKPGRDLFTILMHGARNALIVAAMGIGLAATIATILALISAFYGGTIDLVILTTADGVMSIPQLLLLILATSLFNGHWLDKILDGGFLIGVVFALSGWPFLWRAIRGPAFQTAQEEWIDAAKSYGQKPRNIMQKHILPYVTGYMLIYASMSFGSVVILLAALSFLNVGINPPTPSWGRMVAQGQPYVSTPSWHISMIPGLLIVFVVTGLNALGDGIRDAIDPESEAGRESEAATGGGA